MKNLFLCCIPNVKLKQECTYFIDKRVSVYSITCMLYNALKFKYFLKIFYIPIVY